MKKLIGIYQLALCTLFLSACTSGDIEEGDRELVLKIGQLQPYGLSLPEGYDSYESFGKERWFDGSFVIDYEFDAPIDLQLPYLSSMTELHATNEDACASYSAGNFGVPLGLGDADLSIRDDLFQFGDESRFAYLTLDDEPIGMYFAMCSGRTAFMTIMGGFYFDDIDMWTELVSPVLDDVVAMD